MPAGNIFWWIVLAKIQPAHWLQVNSSRSVRRFLKANQWYCKLYDYFTIFMFQMIEVTNHKNSNIIISVIGFKVLYLLSFQETQPVFIVLLAHDQTFLAFLLHFGSNLTGRRWLSSLQHIILSLWIQLLLRFFFWKTTLIIFTIVMTTLLLCFEHWSLCHAIKWWYSLLMCWSVFYRWNLLRFMFVLLAWIPSHCCIHFRFKSAHWDIRSMQRKEVVGSVWK